MTIRPPSAVKPGEKTPYPEAFGLTENPFRITPFGVVSGPVGTGKTTLARMFAQGGRRRSYTGSRFCRPCLAARSRARARPSGPLRPISGCRSLRGGARSGPWITSALAIASLSPSLSARRRWAHYTLSKFEIK